MRLSDSRWTQSLADACALMRGVKVADLINVVKSTTPFNAWMNPRQNGNRSCPSPEHDDSVQARFPVPDGSIDAGCQSLRTRSHARRMEGHGIS